MNLSDAIEQCKLGEVANVTILKIPNEDGVEKWCVCPIGAAAHTLGMPPAKIARLSASGIEFLWDYVVVTLGAPELNTITVDAFGKTPHNSAQYPFPPVCLRDAIVFAVDCGRWKRADTVKFLRDLNL